MAITINKYKKLGKNTFLILIGNVLSKSIAFFLLPFYTRHLSPSEYGLTDLIFVYASLLVSIITLNISDSIFIFPKDIPVERQKTYFSTGLFFSTILVLISFFIFAFINYISSELKILTTFNPILWYVFFLVVAMNFQLYMQQFTRSINKMVIYSTTGIILSFFTALFSIILVPSYGVFGYILSTVVSYLIAGIYSCIAAKSYLFFSFKKINKLYYIQMLKYSLPLIPNTILWWLTSALNRPLLETYVGISAVGIFAVANKFPGIITTLFNTFSISWTISVIDELKSKDYNIFFNRILKLIYTILILGCIIFTIISPYLISLMTTKEFYISWKYVPVLSLGVVFASLSTFIGANFSAMKRSKYFLYSTIVCSIVAIIGNFILIPLFGIYGACISMVLSFLASVIARLFYSRHIIQITNVSYYVKTIIICIIIITVETGLQEIKIHYLISTLFSIYLLYIIYKDNKGFTKYLNYKETKK